MLNVIVDRYPLFRLLFVNVYGHTFGLCTFADRFPEKLAACAAQQLKPGLKLSFKALKRGQTPQIIHKFSAKIIPGRMPALTLYFFACVRDGRSSDLSIHFLSESGSTVEDILA